MYVSHIRKSNGKKKKKIIIKQQQRHLNILQCQPNDSIRNEILLILFCVSISQYSENINIVCKRSRIIHVIGKTNEAELEERERERETGMDTNKDGRRVKGSLLNGKC